MASDKKSKQPNSIPIRFFDDDEVSAEGVGSEASDFEDVPELIADDEAHFSDGVGEDPPLSARPEEVAEDKGGPALAELVATRAELKRVEAALAEARDSLARRTADFDNYRKRVERDRSEVHNRIVADVAMKLLPVVDNLGRALDAERSIEASESKEFRHFLHGVELINKQLNELLESLGVEPIPAVGERFDPHVHEAVVTEATDEYEPDTVIQEMVRGYRIGGKLVRPAMVKVSAKADSND